MAITKSTQKDTYIDHQGRRIRRMTFEQRAELRRNFTASLPLWRHPLIGYLLSILLVSLLGWGQQALDGWIGGGGIYFAGSLLLLPVLFIATFWGTMPSLFTVLLGALYIDYFFIGYNQSISWQHWEDGLRILPFFISGITIAIITSQRERARWQTLIAEQELKEYAAELEVSNQKLEDANQTKDRFLSIASHELKTPITTIRGQAQLALRRLAKQDGEMNVSDMHTALERINEQTMRLTTLIEELLDVSSLRTGKMALNKSKLNINELCQQVVDDQNLLTGRHIELKLSPKEVMVSVDRDRIEQVLINLVGNAVKYSPEGSVVQVCVERKWRKALIHVRDHGKGIAPDQLEKVFDTFYRTPDAEASTKKGLGLGLSISKEIIERHEGRIWCESQPGQGSEFFVELPLK
ncbi:sensor histidine kinase [Ktedonobacter robiniae]|nr:HAMP domain-containing sensor histidine kinase [Ktedonobacter robiniae]